MVSVDQCEQDLKAMYADVDFMAWLKKTEPDYDFEYSGNLLARWDAFNAGRELLINGSNV